MLFIEITLAALAFVTGVFSIVAFYLSARTKTNDHDKVLGSFMIACVLALGFLGLLLK
jgi:hypothetical protein